MTAEKTDKEKVVQSLLLSCDIVYGFEMCHNIILISSNFYLRLSAAIAAPNLVIAHMKTINSIRSTSSGVEFFGHLFTEMHISLIVY